MPGFLDKMKQAAGEMADAAKKGTTQVQSKAHVHGLRSKADDAAKKLGYLVVRERTEGTAAGAEAGAEADELVAQIVDLEKQIAEAGQSSEEGGEASESSEATEEGGEPPTP